MSTIRDFKINSANFDSSGSVDTIALVEKTLLEAKMTKTDIHYIVITGGSTDVAHMLEEHFGKAPLRDIDPDEVVAHGAAYQGYIISSDTAPNVGCCVDVILLTLGY
jgi:molecular chaperone DnaK (HSP70)